MGYNYVVDDFFMKVIIMSGIQNELRNRYSLA